jgi:DNA-binding CsgD family transcriptional regulator
LVGTENGGRPVLETIKKYRSPKQSLRSVLLTQQRSVSLMFLIAIVLTFILGMFESYSSSQGFTLVTSDVSMLSSCVVVFALYIMSLIKKTSSWFAPVFSVFMLVGVIGLFLALILPESISFLSIFFGIAMVVSLISVCAFVIEFAKEQNISPIFLYGTLPMLLSLAYNFGHILNLLMYQNLNQSFYGISQLAAASLASLAALVVVLFPLSSKRTEEKMVFEEGVADDSAAALFETEQKGSSFKEVSERYGLSDREYSIALMYSQGRSVPYIAKQYYLAETTVKSHLKRVYLKLAIHNKQELIDLVNSAEQ